MLMPYSLGSLLEESGERVDGVHVCADVDAVDTGVGECLKYYCNEIACLG